MFCKQYLLEFYVIILGHLSNLILFYDTQCVYISKNIKSIRNNLKSNAPSPMTLHGMEVKVLWTTHGWETEH